MKVSSLKLLAGALALLALGSVPMAAQEPAAPMTAKEKANLKLALDFWREVIVARHVDLAPKYQAEDYIQHNPNIPTGRDAFVKAFGRNPPQPIPDVIPEAPVVSFAKGDYAVLVWQHAGIDPAKPGQTYNFNSFDIFRIQNGKVQEHWDSARKTTTDAVSHPAVAPPSTAHLKFSDQEKKNIDIFKIEFKDMLQYGHLELADTTMAESYIQHNPNVPGTREGFKAFFGGNPNRKVEDIKPDWKNPPTLVIACGPYVILMRDQKADDPASPGTQYVYDHFDMVRIGDGKIQEHWDEAVKNPPAPARGGGR
jgi:predicted SnoaL-like aldol condensation-catalyzing enzyme